MLLETFAYLTDVLTYRLNRIPQRAYVEFLRLLGVQLSPPAAASTKLRFMRARPSEPPLEIPRGTRVTASRAESGSETPVFVTARAALIAPGESQVEVLAHHCDLVIGELAGTGTGLPGLSLAARRPPIVARTGDELDLIVGVEIGAGELDERAAAIEFEGRPYRIWHEVDNFGNLGEDPHAYIADRIQGTIAFAPAARLTMPNGALEDAAHPLAGVPPAQRQIRLWYRRGGGPQGNVSINTLTVLKDPIPGAEVTNPERATGGRAAETIENAVIGGRRSSSR